MLSPRRFGLLLSACLSVFSQQPVLPLDTLFHATQPVAVTAPAAHDVAVVYDSQEKLWKRWVQESGQPLVLYTSPDKLNWSAATPAFEPASETTAWDHQVTSPVIIYNADASDGQRYLLWYVGSAAGATAHDALIEGDLGLATSVDGRHFKRVAASESPYHVSGLIARGFDAFQDHKHVVSVAMGAPQFSKTSTGYELTFYKVGYDKNGTIAAAGIQRATSNDGTRWQVAAEDPMSLEVVGRQQHQATIVGQLRRIAAAYAVGIN